MESPYIKANHPYIPKHDEQFLQEITILRELWKKEIEPSHLA